MEPVPELVAGDRAVTGEGVDHPGVGGHRGHAAEEHGHHRDDHQQLASLPGDGVHEHLSAGGRPVDGHRRILLRPALQGQGHGQVENEAGDDRDVDGPHDPFRALHGGALGLLGHVGRGVVPGQRVLGQQQSDGEGVDPGEGAGPPGEVLTVEEEAHALVLAGDGEEGDHDDQGADEVPPHADVGQHAHQLHPEGVEQAVGGEDDGVEDEDPLGGGVEVRVVERDQEAHVGGQSVVDRGGDGHLAHQVEPPARPRPRRLVLGSQLGGPVVEAAGSGVGRADLGHAQAHAQDEGADDEPPGGDDQRAAGVHAQVVGGDAAGQDRDDRERDGEVGEGPHPPPELLGVAQLVESLGVLVHPRRIGDLTPGRSDPDGSDLAPGRSAEGLVVVHTHSTRPARKRIILNLP